MNLAASRTLQAKHISLQWKAVGNTTAVLGESPLWSPKEQALYWVDIRGQTLHRYEPSTNKEAAYQFDELVNGVALATNGKLVLAMRHSLVVFDPSTQQCQKLVTLESDMAENRLNELRCDYWGNLWCGSMWDFGHQIRGSLYCVSPNLEVETIRRHIGVPNSLAFSLAQNTVYFADTQQGVIERAKLNELSWSVWQQGSSISGKPDGASFDRDGFLWTVRTGAGCIARLAPNGAVDRVFELPVSHPTACAFGGSNLDTLYVTTSRQRLGPEELISQALAGKLLSVQPGYFGLPEPVFTLASAVSNASKD